MLRATLLLIFALAASSAWADAPLSRASNGQLTAPVRIAGGAAAAFVIDTGADGCSISETFATTRHLLRVGGETRPTMVLAPNVEIDGQNLGDLRCALTPDGAAAGVIGADALGRFVVEMDPGRMQLSLHGGAQHGQALVSPRARLVYGERQPGGALAMPVRFNSASGVAVLATGARRSVVNTRFAKAAGADATALSLGATRGAFYLAGRVTPTVEARVTDLPAFAAAGLRDQPAMFLGLDRLDGLKLVIDYPRGRVWFDPG